MKRISRRLIDSFLVLALAWFAGIEPVHAAHRMISLGKSHFGSSERAAEFLRELRERRQLPARYQYLSQGALDWSRVTREPGYRSLPTQELALLRRRIPEMLRKKLYEAGVNLVDLGPGDGRKGEFILQQLRFAFPGRPVSYVGVDYSPALLALAHDRISFEHPDVAYSQQIADLEHENVAPAVSRLEFETGTASVFLFLGQTLGNPDDAGAVLKNIRTSMMATSQLLVGLDLYEPDKFNQLLPAYRNQAYQDLLFAPFQTIGLVRGRDATLEMELDQAAHSVVSYLVPQIDLNLNHQGESAELRKGERIKVFQSHRFTLEELPSLFEAAGLEITDVARDSSTASLITARPKF